MRNLCDSFDQAFSFDKHGEFLAQIYFTYNCMLWHSLPLDLRSVDTVDAFKKKLNENLLLFRILFYIKKHKLEKHKSINKLYFFSLKQDII